MVDPYKTIKVIYMYNMCGCTLSIYYQLHVVQFEQKNQFQPKQCTLHVCTQ